MNETQGPHLGVRGARGIRLRGREVARIEAFSDAVFGFAATLLVVSLEVPKTFAELLSSLQGFVAFAFSFTALVAIWAVHNSFFRRYGLQDRTTVVLNAVLLFVVLFYVYPLKFLTVSLSNWLLRVVPPAGAEPRFASLNDLGTLFVIYGLGFVAVFAAIALLYAHAARPTTALDLDALERFDARTRSRHYLIFAAVGLLSMALAGAQVGLRVGAPGWTYALLGPLCQAHASWSERRRSRLATADETKETK
ncbi:MAG TPA: TMEM175 family protein [Thermoanaerobaculia bacterium]|nr:TMEM175 family protein [Thermoanaerobaculia bacterium]